MAVCSLECRARTSKRIKDPEWTLFLPSRQSQGSNDAPMRPDNDNDTHVTRSSPDKREPKSKSEG